MKRVSLLQWKCSVYKTVIRGSTISTLTVRSSSTVSFSSVAGTSDSSNCLAISLVYLLNGTEILIFLQRRYNRAKCSIPGKQLAKCGGGGGGFPCKDNDPIQPRKSEIF